MDNPVPSATKDDENSPIPMDLSITRSAAMDHNWAPTVSMGLSLPLAGAVLYGFESSTRSLQILLLLIDVIGRLSQLILPMANSPTKLRFGIFTQIYTFLKAMKSITTNNRILPSEVGEFILFPLLPAEIRRKIWQFALPDERMVMIKRYASPFSHQVSLQTNIPQLNLLSVNAESRMVTREKYWLPLGNTTISGEQQWINPEDDILVLPHSSQNHSTDPQLSLLYGFDWSTEAKRHLKHVAIDITLLQTSNHGTWGGAAHLGPLRNLLTHTGVKEITFILQVHDDHIDDLMNWRVFRRNMVVVDNWKLNDMTLALLRSFQSYKELEILVRQFCQARMRSEPEMHGIQLL